MNYKTKLFKSEYFIGGKCRVLFNDEITIVRFLDFYTNEVIKEKTFDTFFELSKIGDYIDNNGSNFWAGKIIKYINSKI